MRRRVAANFRSRVMPVIIKRNESTHAKFRPRKLKLVLSIKKIGDQYEVDFHLDDNRHVYIPRTTTSIMNTRTTNTRYMVKHSEMETFMDELIEQNFRDIYEDYD